MNKTGKGKPEILEGKWKIIQGKWLITKESSNRFGELIDYNPKGKWDLYQLDIEVPAAGSCCAPPTRQ